jgi:ribosome-associated protein
MDIRKLQRVIVDGLEDVKAQNIVVFNTEHLSPLFERVIVASGTSNRQTRSLAASVRDAVKSAGAPPPRTEGEDNGEWIIVDCGAAVVHVMQPAIREYYHLEELWGEKPVRMKIADGASRRSRQIDGDDRHARPRAAGARKLAAKRPVVRTAGAKSPAASAKGSPKKPVQKTARARPAAKARRPAAKSAGVRR